jgi:hypothetical protein
VVGMLIGSTDFRTDRSFYCMNCDKTYAYNFTHSSKFGRPSLNS